MPPHPNNQLPTFEEFLTSQAVTIPLLEFSINLVLAAVLAAILGWVYLRYGSSLSNRRSFARNFVLMATTTTLIITVVKSSLALSLGLVGALSIVRFRAAIKEPEELCYLFITIAIGLGLGADQREVTLLGFVVIVALIGVRQWLVKGIEHPNLLLTVASGGGKPLELAQVADLLRSHSAEAMLKRYDQSSDRIEARFLVAYDSFDQLESCRAALRGLGESTQISFLDSRGIEP